jgi:hypothetical protein
MSPFTARIYRIEFLGTTTWCPAHAAADTTVASSTPRHSATTGSVAARSSAISLPDVAPAPGQRLASVVAACAGNKKPRLGGRGLGRGNVRRKPDLVVGESEMWVHFPSGRPFGIEGEPGSQDLQAATPLRRRGHQRSSSESHLRGSFL